MRLNTVELRFEVVIYSKLVYRVYKYKYLSKKFTNIEVHNVYLILDRIDIEHKEAYSYDLLQWRSEDFSIN